MTTETERTAAAIRDNPNGLDPVHAPEVDYTFEFERHQLIAMAACLAIGGLFAVGVYFLPVVAGWVVGL